MRKFALAAFALVVSASPVIAAGHGVVKSRLICNDRGQCVRAPYMHPVFVPDMTLRDYYGPYPRYYHAGPLRGYNFGIGGWIYDPY